MSPSMTGGREIDGKSASDVSAEAEEANNTKAHATKVLDRLGLRKVCPSVQLKLIEPWKMKVA
jgi:DNA-directed RNA polymerase subunit N (RpoN/RPB10)